MILELDAAERPCEMRKSHNPTPIRTQSHHRFPVYLQKRLWGSVRHDDRIALCGTDHDSLHTWIAVLLGEQARPTLSPGWLVEREAQFVIEWFRREQTEQGTFGSGAFGVGPYGGAVGDPAAEWDGIE